MDTWENIKQQIKIETRDYFRPKEIDTDSLIDLLKQVINFPIDEEFKISGLSSNITNALSTFFDDEAGKKDRIAHFQYLKNFEPLLKKIIFIINPEHLKELQSEKEMAIKLLTELNLLPKGLWLDEELCCSKLLANVSSDEKQQIISDYLGSLFITRESIPFQYFKYYHDNCYIFYDGRNSLFTAPYYDALELFDQFEALVLGYTIQNIYIHFTKWRIINSLSEYTYVLDKMNLFIQSYLYAFSEAPCNGAENLMRPLDMKNPLEKYLFLTSKFYIIVRLAKYVYESATEKGDWENSFFEKKLYDDKYPSKSNSYFKLTRTFISNISRNPNDTISLWNGYVALAKGLDLLAMLGDIIYILKEMSPEEKLQYYPDLDEFEKVYILYNFMRDNYEEFVYRDTYFYKNKREKYEIKKLLWEEARAQEKKEDELKYRKELLNIFELHEKETYTVIEKQLEFMYAYLSDDIDELMTAKSQYLKAISKYASNVQQEKLEEYTKQLCEKIKLSVQNEDEYLSIYEKISDDFSIYFEHLKPYPSLLNSLASAEYLYKIYILQMKEKESFDYSSVSLMYYLSLEDFLNKFLYHPYKKDVLSPEFGNICNSKDYLNQYEYYIRYSKLKKNCELGPLSFLCSEVLTTSKLRNYLIEKYNFTEDKLQKLKSFGDNLKTKTQFRNDAAHGGVIITYSRAAQDKEIVYPGLSEIINIRGLLKEFMTIFFN